MISAPEFMKHAAVAQACGFGARRLTLTMTLRPLNPMPIDASETERLYAAQFVKIQRLMDARDFRDMPAAHQRLKQLQDLVRAERLATKAAKATKD